MGILRSGEQVKLIPIMGDYALFDRWRWPLRPMLGVIGVAPATGELDCMIPGMHGGNLDTNDVCPGSTLHLKAETLDAASWMAVEEMRRILTDHFDADADTARWLTGVLGHVRVSQIVNPLKTVRVELPLLHLTATSLWPLISTNQ